MTEKIKNEYYIQMKRVILSGGGTGGHIYPAVAVAEALQRRCGDGVELLFVGAEGKMEMEKIPALGYRIVGLPTAGLQRRFALSNLALPFKVLKSVGRARRTIREFGADVVVSRSGACSVSELCLVGKPTLFVPSPNVAEDHQTKNAQALVDRQAAVLVADAEAPARAMETAGELLADPARRTLLARNIAALAVPDAAERIVDEIEKIW